MLGQARCFSFLSEDLRFATCFYITQLFLAGGSFAQFDLDLSVDNMLGLLMAHDFQLIS